MPVDVYSGIAPPPALLAEMAKKSDSSSAGIRRATQPVPRPQSFSAASQAPPPFTSSSRPSSTSAALRPPSSDVPEDAPPSYEDAMAEELAPVDGPRRGYTQQPQSNPVVGDSKRGGNFSNSERLFP
jgi:hypothetical protein